MKNALILTGVWLGILVTAYAIVFWDQGIERPLPISVLEQQAEMAEPDYVHPDWLFSVSAPMGWQMEVDGDMATMEDPNGNVTVWIVATHAAALDDVLDEALAWVDAGDDFSRIASVSLPIGEWYGEDVSVTYRSESIDDVVTVRAQRPDDWTILLVAHGQERTLEALSENLEWIWSELEIPADMAKLL
jgi:hypothetical protein